MAGALGLQVESLEPSMDGGLGNAGLGGQGADAPTGGSGWWLQWRIAHFRHSPVIMGAVAARAFFLLQPCPGGASDGAICPPSSCSPPVAGQSPSGTSLITGQNVGAAAPGQGAAPGSGSWTPIPLSLARPMELGGDQCPWAYSSHGWTPSILSHLPPGRFTSG